MPGSSPGMTGGFYGARQEVLRPTSVTIAKRPSVWDGMAESINLFLPNRQAKYFWRAHWTRNWPDRPSGQISRLGQPVLAVRRLAYRRLAASEVCWSSLRVPAARGADRTASAD